MKNKIAFAILALTAFFFSNPASAALNINAAVDVPKSCTVTDTVGANHTYSGSYLAVCALDAAMKNGSVTSTGLSNEYPSLGLFIVAINGVAANPASEYWSIYQNGGMASQGIVSLPVSAGDTIMFQLHDFSDNNLGDQAVLHINSLIPAASGAVGSAPLVSPSDVPGVINTSEKTAKLEKPGKVSFDMGKALDFLSSEQKENGSFPGELYTDWTAIGLASLEENQKVNSIIRLVKYFSENKISGALLTDYERHAMALMSLGLNPYDSAGENYIKKISDSFDGRQFGDPDKDNDDIFALIALSGAGYGKNEDMMKKDANFVISKQESDGSWDGSPDMTGAGIEALSSFLDDENAKSAMEKAKKYLSDKQNDDGGFGNVSSTAWAMEGIMAQDGKPGGWTKNGKSPIDYLASMQGENGEMKSDSIEGRIWQTAYAIKALSGKTWLQTMQKFEKPETETQVKTEKSEPGKTEIIETRKTPKAEASQNVPKETLKNLPEKRQPAMQPAVSVTPNAQPEKSGWFKNLLAKILEIF